MEVEENSDVFFWAMMAFLTRSQAKLIEYSFTSRFINFSILFVQDDDIHNRKFQDNNRQCSNINSLPYFSFNGLDQCDH